MTIQDCLSKFVVVEPDRRVRTSGEHGGMEMVTHWRVVLVWGTDRLTLTALSERATCEAYATDLRQRFLGPLLIEVRTQEQEACVAVLMARGGRL